MTRDSSNSFAIDMGDGSEVKDKRPIDKATQLATGESTSEQIVLKPSEPSSSSERALPGSELIKIAEKLGHDQHRWQQTENSPSPKCNQYVEAVLKAGHIPFPWKAGFADCHAMREAFDKECQRPGSKWEKVYVYDYKQGSASDDQFTHYIPKNGDVMIWDGPWGNENVQHSGIAAEPYDILYAGSQSAKAPHGWAHGKITDFTQSTKSYGAPTAVYRYKGP